MGQTLSNLIFRPYLESFHQREPLRPPSMKADLIFWGGVSRSIVKVLSLLRKPKKAVFMGGK